jgi:hypothetical protein
MLGLEFAIGVASLAVFVALSTKLGGAAPPRRNSATAGQRDSGTA